MFDIGGLELMLIAIVSLLILGPERLPEMLRTLGLWLGRLRRSFTSVKAEIEKEIGMDEVRRQLHNEAVMEEMKRIEREVQASVDDAKIDPNLVSGDAGAQTAPSTGDAVPEDATESTESSGDETAVQPAAASEPPPYEPPKPRPRSEAEVEAAYERKMRAREAEAKAAKDS